jgi:spermidine synthase
LNGNLQFSSADEYRYHEALIHPGLSRISHPKDILILGGGDGMAAREILKYPSVHSIHLIDLDEAITSLFKNNKGLQKLNSTSLQSPKVSIQNVDAFQWIREQQQQYDFVAVDFPDPANYSLGKLYTVAFYKELFQHVRDSGAVVIQATSPFVAKQSFWIINETLTKAGFKTAPYHCHVPSFGEWGFILAYKNFLPQAQQLPSGLKFITKNSWASLSGFPPDMVVLESPINTLNNQVLVNTFEKEWAVYSR